MRTRSNQWIVPVAACVAFTACGKSGRDPNAGTPDAAPVMMQPDAVVPVTVTIEAPVEGAWVKSPVTVSGAVTGAVAQVLVNDRETPVLDGRYQARLSLTDGPQTIAVAAGDVRAVVHVQHDSTAPRLEVSAPDRGTWTEDSEVTVAFHASDPQGLSEVIFEGRNIEPGRGPDFQLEAPLSTGLNLFRIRAVDAAGNFSREHITTLRGQLTRVSHIPSGFRLRVGPRGFEAIGDAAGRIFDAADLAALLPDTGYELGPFRVSLGELTHARNTSIELAPTDGAIATRLVAHDVRLGLDLTLGEADVRALVVDAQQVVFEGRLGLSVADGAIEASTEDVTVRFEGLRLSLADLQGEWDDPNGETLTERLLEEIVTAAAQEFVEDFAVDLLSRFEQVVEVEIFGLAIRVEVTPEVLVLNPAGLSARLGFGLDLLVPPANPPQFDAYVTTPTNWDGAPDTEGIAIAVDDDVINLTLFQLWRGGALFPRLDRAFFASQMNALQLTLSLLGTAVQSAYRDILPTTPIAIETRLPTPPFARLTADGDVANIELSIGDFDMVVVTETANPRTVVEGAASIRLLAEVTTVADPEPRLQLRSEATRFESAFDVATPALRGPLEALVEEHAISLFESFSAAVPSFFDALPIPSLAGFQITDLKLRLEHHDTDFLVLEGTVLGPR